MDIWFFDFEIYQNLIMLTCLNKENNTAKFIIYSNKDTYYENDLDKIVRFANDKQKYFIGYNSFHYDNQILNYLIKEYKTLSKLSEEEITNRIYTLSNDIINNDSKKYKYNKFFKSIDLLRVANIKKPLKLVAIALKWHKIQDLPIKSDEFIYDNQLNELWNYNLNDVQITRALYDKIIDQVRLRADITYDYGINVMNEPNSGIANKLFEKLYSHSTNQEINSFNKKKTDRSYIDFKDAIFDTIKFKSNQFNILLDRLKWMRLNIVKGKKVTFNLNSVEFEGISYQIGAGGLHSIDFGCIYESNNTIIIKDADVTSYYPSLMINHNIKPNHLSNHFIEILKKLKEERVIAKKEGNKTKAEALKIVVNSIYGKMGNEFSWFYDPLAQLQVTLNGQLYLLMLVEELVYNGFKVISANTDGITSIINRSKEQEYFEVCKKWSEYTNLDLEFTNYDKYIRRDVNNYITLSDNKKIKEKGEFLLEKSLDKGFDRPIIAKALYEFYINKIPIEDTIKNHRDIFDFCLSEKSDIKFNNKYHTYKEGKHIVEDIQRSVRYYVCNKSSGGILLKTTDKKSISHVANYNIMLFNNYIYYEDFTKYDINYKYYISEVYKIVNQVTPLQKTIFDGI